MDIPLLRDNDDSYGFYAAAGGYLDGWRGAQLFLSRDGGASYDDVEAGIFLTAAALGYADTALGSVALFDQVDEAHTVDVTLTSGELASTTRAALLEGAVNVALLGDEILKFRDATLLSAGKYRLSGLLRARRGTDWAVGAHAVNERFVLLSSSSVRFIPLASAELNVERAYKGVSIRNTLAGTEAEAFTNTGVNLKPLAPAHVGGGRDAANNLTIAWKRRTRLLNVWRDYVDAPLGEDSESYEVDIMDGAAVVRTIAASSQTASYTAAQQTTDGFTPGDPITLKVYQLSAQVGRGYAATATV
jgi:hypothetical protein